MLGDSAAAVSAMTAAWDCLFAALAGFRKKASSCEGASRVLKKGGEICAL
jgi:hypothetical protein